ncbi:hypothetical protein LguiA_009876 [Lonicera macranthoides]
MWRRLSTQLRSLTSSRSASTPYRYIAAGDISPSPLRSAVSLFSRQFTATFESVVSKKRVEDVVPIATGHEREELEAELQGRNILDINFPEGPFGTKVSAACYGLEDLLRSLLLLSFDHLTMEAPAVVKSYYDKRIVGCPGGEGEDEHDVVWFWLEKGKPHECPVCTQYFVLEVVGPGGPPDGHGEDDHH